LVGFFFLIDPNSEDMFASASVPKSVNFVNELDSWLFVGQFGHYCLSKGDWITGMGGDGYVQASNKWKRQIHQTLRLNDELFLCHLISNGLNFGFILDIFANAC
jgi:hypothetical protein